MDNLQGSILSPENFDKFYLAKQRLEIIKSHKLQLRDEKHKEIDHSAEWSMAHIESEVKELREGFDRGDVENQLEELADIINCCEIRAMMLIY